MGERYWVTGVQLGLMHTPRKKERSKLIQHVINNQFIGNYPTDKDKERFMRWIKKNKKVKEARG